MGFDNLNFHVRKLPSQSCLSNYYCLFVYLLRGHCQSSHFLCLNCWIQKACVAFGLRMSCNAVSHGPSLTHLCDLERPLAGRWNLAGPGGSEQARPWLCSWGIFVARGPGSPANEFRREPDICLFFGYFLPCRFSFPNFRNYYSKARIVESLSSTPCRHTSRLSGSCFRAPFVRTMWNTA